jgi:trehalose synthase
MWKRVPVLAAAVGGVRAQVQHGRTGVLVEDPADLAAFGAGLANLLADPDSARAFGAAGHERVRERFLADRHLIAWTDLLCRLAETVATTDAPPHAAPHSVHQRR